MSLSLEGKDPIARIVCLDSDNTRFVYINPPQICKVEAVYPIPDEETKAYIEQAMNDGADFDELLVEMYPEIQEDEIEEQSIKYLKPPGNVLINIVPSPKSENIMIAGKKGLGKSFFAAMYAKEYRAMFPDNDIYLFCRSDEDPAFDNLHIGILDKVVDSECDTINNTMEQFENSLVIFDDMDNLPDKKQRQRITALMSDIMANGRKLNIYCLYLTHVIFNREQTKAPINESDKFVFFIGGNTKHNRKFLSENVGLEKFDVDKILNLKTRWVCLNLTPPKYIVTEKEIILI